MQITITIETPLSDGDRAILHTLAGDALDVPVQATAKKATPKASKATEGTKAPEQDEKPSETPPEVSETGDEESGVDQELLDKAIKRATHLIRVEKRQAEVKAALTEVGVEKVTHLDDNAKIQAFLDSLPED